MQVGGVAARRAAREVRLSAAKLAADLLEANPADIVYDAPGRRFHVAGTPHVSLTLAEVAVWSEVGAATLGTDGRLEIAATEAEPLVRRLLDRDPSLSDLEVRTAGLEEALLTLTARQQEAA